MANSSSHDCQPCRRDDERSSAIGFCVDCDERVCQKCWDVHAKMRTLQSHSLIDKGDKGTYKFDKIPARQCPIHDEIQEYVCVSCNVLVCNRCVGSRHSLCDNAYLPDLSTFNCQDTEVVDVRALEKGLDATIKGLKTLQRKKREYISAVDRMHSDIARNIKGFLEDVESFFKIISTSIEESVEQLVDEWANLSEPGSKALRSAMEEFWKLDGELTRMEEDDACNRDKANLSRVLRDMNKIKSVIVDRASSGEGHNYTQIQEELDKIITFLMGMWDFAQESELIPIPDDQFADFSLRTNSDTNAPAITGFLKTADTIIVADRGNKKIKLFQNSGKKQLELPFPDVTF